MNLLRLRTAVERRRYPCCLGPLRIPVAAYISTCLSTSVPNSIPTERECSLPCLNYNRPITYSICKTHQDCPHLSHAFIIRSQVSAECMAEHTIGCKRFSESSLNGCRKASPSNSLKTFNRFTSRAYKDCQLSRMCANPSMTRSRSPKSWNLTLSFTFQTNSLGRPLDHRTDIPVRTQQKQDRNWKRHERAS